MHEKLDLEAIVDDYGHWEAAIVVVVDATRMPSEARKIIAVVRALELTNGSASTARPVVFDEYHHGFTFSDLSPQAWVLTPWGAGSFSRAEWLAFLGWSALGAAFWAARQRALDIPCS